MRGDKDTFVIPKSIKKKKNSKLLDKKIKRIKANLAKQVTTAFKHRKR